MLEEELTEEAAEDVENLLESYFAQVSWARVGCGLCPHACPSAAQCGRPPGPIAHSHPHLPHPLSHPPAQVDAHYDKLRNIGEYIEDTEVR